MSIFGALSTAVSGLSAQSHAFTDISNNISNSQTVGYKATDTDFSDYVLTSADAQGTNGTVLATTASENEAQGTITSSTNALALAISGRGFFSVDEESGDSTTASKAFQNTAYYTRNGDFTQNNLGYLVNSSDEYLNGYMVDPSTGTLNTSTLQTINVANVAFRPVASTTVTATTTLPGATVAAAGTGQASGSTTQSATVIDSAGASQSLGLQWTYGGTDASTGASTWTVAGTEGTSGGTNTATVTFNSAGAITSIASPTTTTDSSGTATTTTGTNTTTGSTASFTIPASGAYGAVTVNLGSIGSSSSGTTMAASSSATGSAGSASADGAATGVYQGISMTADGNIMANFDNGQSQLVGKVPLAMFADANALLAHDGEAYTATSESGAATVSLAGESGAGDLETSSVENSTTSLDTDLTKLITAQQAYGANAKVVTTADQMLQTVLSLKQ